jgi:hypothetical protein
LLSASTNSAFDNDISISSDYYLNTTFEL